MASMVVTPITLRFEADLVPGSVATPDPGVSIKNPYRAPMWVDELRFRLSPSGTDCMPGFVVSVRAKLNGKYFINEPVALPAFIPQLDISETLIGGDTPTYIWKLWKPIWLDADDEMNIELSWQTPQLPATAGVSTVLAWGNTGTCNVQTTVLGRSTTVNNRPQVRHLPWVVQWKTEFINSASPSPYLQRSYDTAIANSLKHHVNARRLLCAFSFGNDYPQAFNSVPETWIDNTLRISDSNGVYVAKDPIPLFELFTGSTRAFDLNFVMKPKEFWTLEFEFGHPEWLKGSLIPANDTTNVFYQFALTGFTDEVLKPL